MGEEELRQLIRGCIKQERKSQKDLYQAFYGFAMSICLRYAGNREEAAGVMNEGFLKAFMHIESFKMTMPFKAWLGRIMINASIDFYRSNLKRNFFDDIEKAEHINEGASIENSLNYGDLLKMVQRLPHAYRTVFNLFAIEGYAHEEIAQMLNINAGTSKSNLFKARQKLRDMIKKADSATGKTSYKTDVDFTPIVAIKTPDIKGVYLNNGITG
jgi:RNA polymerase sigma-70 factor (ECF subfamily)